MTNDERIAQVVEMAFKADLDEDAKVIVNEAIRVATEANAELDDIWEDYNTMKTKYDYVVGLVAHLEELAKKYKEEVEEYRTKLENGALVELPCKVGQPIWIICYELWTTKPFVDESFIKSFVQIAMIMEHGEIGKTVFLTKAEAEAKLRELKEKENADKD